MSERLHTRLDKNAVQLYARIGGALYLAVIVIGILGEAAIRGSLVAWGDAAATAHQIAASELLWRVGVAGQLVLLICAIALTCIWYVLLRPVHRNLTLLAMFFAVVSLVIEAVGALHLQAALVPLTSTALTVLEPRQLHALAYMSVVAHTQTFGTALLFFGVQCLIVGHLIRASGFFPKVLGSMLQIAGLCYLINSFGQLLFPALPLFPAILLPSLIGEGALCLWLLIIGVDGAAWERRATMRPVVAAC